MDGAEPNDAPADATAVPVPVALVQSFNQSDRQDFYRFTLTSTVTVRGQLFWNTGNDLDVLVQPAGTAVAFEGDGSQAFGNDLCGSTGATANPSETALCPDLPPGDYVLHVIDFDFFHAGDSAVKSYWMQLEVVN